ncbi:MAG: hypothetical protein GEU99_15005 [Luteitalea sp.]|nr:hypothetical protein [Luteitalea sp.]
MRKMSDIAVKQCVVELRAACRLPIDELALDTLVGWLRPNFEQILDCRDGRKRWADHGQRMRDNARHIGAFADFFGSHVGATTVGLDELKRAFQIVRGACTVRANSGPDASEDCAAGRAPLDTGPIEEFLRAGRPAPDAREGDKVGG